MKKTEFHDVTDTQLEAISNFLSNAVQAKQVTFGNEKITDQHIKDAEQSARQYAEARNKKGNTPRSNAGASATERETRAQTLDWLSRRGGRMRGV